MNVIWFLITTAVVLAAPLTAATQDAAGPPLPPVETVLQRAVEKAQTEDDQEREFKARYYFLRNKVTEYHNSNGDLKKHEEKKRENNPLVAPVAYHPPPTQSKINSRLPEKNDTVTDTHSNVRGNAFEKEDFLLNDELLSRFEFKLAGREPLNGRTALVLDFQPANRKLPERNLKDRFINKAAGRVWVDETDYALVKADLHLTKRVNVVGGLVGAVWKFTFGFNRERSPEGLWFTRDSNWHLEGRELFVRRTVDYHEERTGVRKVW